MEELICTVIIAIYFIGVFKAFNLAFKNICEEFPRLSIDGSDVVFFTIVSVSSWLYILICFIAKVLEEKRC